jgi:hypothetical protein
MAGSLPFAFRDDSLVADVTSVSAPASAGSSNAYQLEIGCPRLFWPPRTITASTPMLAVKSKLVLGWFGFFG